MSGVTVDEGALGESRGWGGYPDPVFLVRADDPARAARAVLVASYRFSAVGDDGVEHPEWEDVSDEVYTPNFVSPVYDTEAGLLVWTDCKGEVPAVMGEAMLRVLVEELERAGVEATVRRPSDWGEWEGREYRFPGGGREARRPDPSEISCCVVRKVPSRTVDGRRYRGAQYWAARGGWTSEPSEAARFEDHPTELIETLLEAFPHQVMGLRRQGDDDAWPQPPRELRMPNA